jgi:uncharacterized phage protein (TIGR01671 family)
VHEKVNISSNGGNILKSRRADMREILFRGKEIGSGKWITGHGYAKYDFSRYVFDDEYPDKIRVPRGLIMVFADTVGQYTGIEDRNGVKIWEGDIITLYRYGFYHCEVRYNEKHTAFEAVSIESGDWFQILDVRVSDITVIGNIHDNPELLVRENNQREEKKT